MSKLDKSVSRISRISMQIFIRAAKSEEDIFFICPKLPKMNQKLLNGELNELSECFLFTGGRKGNKYPFGSSKIIQCTIF